MSSLYNANGMDSHLAVLSSISQENEARQLCLRRMSDSSLSRENDADASSKARARLSMGGLEVSTPYLRIVCWDEAFIGE